MAPMARFLTPALRRFVPLLHRTGVTCVVILQMRLDPGQMFGDPRKVSGGMALKHAASVWMDVAKINGTEIAKDDEPIGHTIKVKIKKNKVAVPFKEAETVIHYMKGVDRRSELAAQAMKRGIITHPEGASENSNTWTHPKMGRVVGVNAVLEAINDNKELARILHKEITAYLKKEQGQKSEELFEAESPPETQDELAWEDMESEAQQATSLGVRDELITLSLIKLKDLAGSKDIKGRHTMSKQELVEALIPVIEQEDQEKQPTVAIEENNNQSKTSDTNEVSAE